MFVCWKLGVFPWIRAPTSAPHVLTPSWVPRRPHPSRWESLVPPGGLGTPWVQFLGAAASFPEKDHEGQGTSSLSPVSWWHRPGACGRPAVLSSRQAGRRAGGLCTHKDELNLS